jgi:hypothetical protein
MNNKETVHHNGAGGVSDTVVMDGKESVAGFTSPMAMQNPMSREASDDDGVLG